MAFVGSRWWLGATVAALTSLGAQGQEQGKEQPQSCPGLVASTRPLVQAVVFRRRLHATRSRSPSSVTRLS